jgi:hypothetical protein
MRTKKAKDAIESFESMLDKAEARALSTVSQERELTEKELKIFRERCRKLGIKV